MERDLDGEVLRRAGVGRIPDAEVSQSDAASLPEEPSFALLGSSGLCVARASSRGAWHALCWAFHPQPAIHVRRADDAAVPERRVHFDLAADDTSDETSDEGRDDSLAVLAGMGYPFSFS